MATPTDATHRNSGGDLFKRDSFQDDCWLQWSSASYCWFYAGEVAEKLTAIGMPCAAPAPAPALPPVAQVVQPSTPEPVYPRRVTKFETADGELHESEEAAVRHQLLRDLDALAADHHNEFGFDDQAFMEALISRYELQKK